MNKEQLVIVFFVLIVCGPTTFLNGQSNPDSVQHESRKKWIVGGAQASLWVGTFYSLNTAWYQNYSRKPFHVFNDWPEWKQMDKLGHVWTTYQISRASAASWKWAGMSHGKAVWLGAVSGMAFQSIIELLDGFSEKWGFSWYDMLANASGASFFVAQTLHNSSPALSLKLSYMPVSYSPEWRERAADLFGRSAAGRVLKDYNGQTYWISANLKTITRSDAVPEWLNLAVGYGASTMLGGRSNSWTDNGTIVTATNITRERKLLLSFDVDLTKIPTRKKWLKTTFSLLNCLKIPAPAIEYRTNGRWQLHPLHY